MNLAPPVYQFLSAATGVAKDGQLDIYALPGIQISSSSGCASPATRQTEEKA